MMRSGILGFVYKVTRTGGSLDEASLFGGSEMSNDGPMLIAVKSLAYKGGV